MNARSLGRWVLWFGLALTWFLPVGVAAAQVDDDARELGERLVAPCCWRETLGSHNSELATELRDEIRARLEAGETAATIEEDMVRRFGPDVRALPRQWDPRVVFGSIAFGVAGLGLVLVVLRVRRRRSVATAAPVEPSSQADDRHVDALDDELAALDL